MAANKSRRKVGWSLALIVPVLLAGGAYVVGYLLTGDRTPAKAAVHGVPVGGLSQAQAEQKLTTELIPIADKEVVLNVAGKEQKIKPSEWGMSIDVAASVQQSGVGDSFDPRHIWLVLTGGQNVAPVIKVDDAQLAAKVAELAKTTDRAAVDASVEIADGKLKVTKAQKSATLQQPDTANRIKQVYLTDVAVDVPIVEADPKISDAAAADAVAAGNAAMSGPVALSIANSSVKYEVPAASILGALSFPVVDGKITMQVDQGKLWAANQEGVGKLTLVKPKDARVEIQGGKPVVIPSVDGVALSKESFLAAVTPVVTKTGAERKAEAQATAMKAKYTTEDAQKAGVKELISSYTSYYPPAAYRDTNLGVVARLINNTYLPPGAQFSLNKEIGPRTRAKGFVDGPFIAGNRIQTGLAGGISQSATTVLNTAFFSGARIDEHRPHTLYYTRYPKGREATVVDGAIDVKFTNDSPYGMVIEAFVDKSGPDKRGSLTVRIWSTKYFKVETAEPTASNYYDSSQPTEYVKGGNCSNQAPSPGFTARYYRITRKPDGSLFRPREDFVWKYSAAHRVVCT